MTRLLAGCSLCVFLLAWPAAAQTSSASSAPEAPAPAHLAVIDGVAWLDRQGHSEPAPLNTPLVTGDRLRTERGRVEVLFGDGSALDLDYFTTVDFQSDALLRLLGGRLRLTVAGLDPNNPDERVTYRIDTPSAAVDVLTVGDYRVSLIGVPVANDTELAVLRGSANLVTDAASITVGAGARSVVRAGAAPSPPVAFNSARWDAFDRWSEDQQSARLGITSNTYLPAPLASYASTFDRYGAWRQDPTYGNVWYPAVGADWEPYSYGNWSYIGPYGWTWIGADPWAWPTYHYGRWGFSAGLWFWIPGVHWGPAWVSWAWAPGYVGWCPLGYYGWPVFGLNAAYWPHYQSHPGHYAYHGWHFAHAGAFDGGHVSPRAHGVPADRLDAGTRAAFVDHAAAPVPRGVAVTRPASPIRVAGDRLGYSVPRTLANTSSPTRPGAAAVPSAGGRAAQRSPAAFGGALAAPPRYGPTANSPGLANLAPSAHAREAVRSDRTTAPAGLGSPSRSAPSYAPAYAPAAPRQYSLPGAAAPRYELPSAPMRYRGSPGGDGRAYQRGNVSSAGSPESNPSPRARPSGSGDGGAVQRGAGSRSSGGSPSGSHASAPRGGHGGGAARRSPD